MRFSIKQLISNKIFRVLRYIQRIATLLSAILKIKEYLGDSMKKPFVVVWLICILMAPGFLVHVREINVVLQDTESPVIETWTWQQKLTEADELLKNIDLFVGEKEIPYTENRFQTVGDRIIRITQHRSDVERQLALVLLNTNTGQEKLVIVTHRGNDLISPKDMPIEIVEMPSGIRWNDWNTAFRAPDPLVIIKNKWPHMITIDSGKRKMVRNSKGKLYAVAIMEKVIEYIVYAPYSDGLHVPELTEGGQQQNKNVVIQAREYLRQHQVYSKTFPDLLVVDVPQLPDSYITILPILEHTDPSELNKEASSDSAQHAAERILVLLAANGDMAFSGTKSPKSALGQYQWTRGTWTLMRKVFPDASLPVDFVSGAGNPVFAAAAALLLHDYNLSQLVSRFGLDILDVPYIEELLQASFNGGVSRAILAQKAKEKHHLSDWLDGLKYVPIRGNAEVRGYIAKFRKLRQLGFKDSVKNLTLIPTTRSVS